MNIIADTSAHFMIRMDIRTNSVYNLLLPLERMATLYIYSRNDHRKPVRIIHILGLVSVFCIYLVGYFNNGELSSELHKYSNLWTGLIVASLSYLQIRSLAIGEAGDSKVLVFFSIANFLYYTIMISSLSALPLAMQIDMDFASKLYSINLFGYLLWSLILIYAAPWKTHKT